MRVLWLIIPISYNAMVKKINSKPDEYSAEQTPYNTEVSYQKVQGSMLKTLRDGTTKPSQGDLITIVVIILEPIGWLHRFYLKMSSLPRRQRLQKKGKPAPWCDLVCPEFSPATLVLEYFAFLARGLAPRLRLLFGRKYPNFEAWASHEVTLLAALRRGISVASSWVYVRSYQRLLKPPWIWAIVTDPRHSEDKVTEVIHQFDTLPLEQIDEDWTHKLRKMLGARGLDGNALRNGIWLRVPVIWTLVVVGTVAPV